MGWIEEKLEIKTDVSETLKFKNSVKLFYLHKADLYASIIIRLNQYHLMANCEPANYANLRKLKDLNIFKDNDNYLEVLKERFDDKYQKVYKVQLIELLKKITAIECEYLITSAPTNNAYFEYPNIQCIFTKDDKPLGHADTSDLEAWNSISLKEGIEFNKKYDKVIILDDCYSSGRTLNICIQRIKDVLKYNPEIICIALLKHGTESSILDVYSDGYLKK